VGTDKGNADTARNPTPPARRQRPTGALLSPSFEPRPLFLSGRGSKLGTPTAAQKQPTCRASGLAEAWRGGCSASHPPQKPGITPPAEEQDLRCLRCGHERAQRKGSQPKQTRESTFTPQTWFELPARSCQYASGDRSKIHERAIATSQLQPRRQPTATKWEQGFRWQWNRK
jgi:hypothetical protein